MILIDNNNIAHARDDGGAWRPATEEELSLAGVNAEGYMHGWYWGLLSGLTIGAILLCALAWVATYVKCGG